MQHKIRILLCTLHLKRFYAFAFHSTLAASITIGIIQEIWANAH